MLDDVAGKPLYAWDSRGHRLRTAYDALRRPTGRSYGCATGDGPGGGLVERTVYGEAQPDDAGAATCAAGSYQVVRRRRRRHQRRPTTSRATRCAAAASWPRDYTAALDWSAAVALEAEDVHEPPRRYDALNRPVT